VWCGLGVNRKAGTMSETMVGLKGYSRVKYDQWKESNLRQ
jgi:hypothetical protein